MLAKHHHGKGQIRVMKVFRQPDKHYVKQFLVETNLFGPVDECFLEGDNGGIVATDTQKNTVFCMLKKLTFERNSAEDFAMLISKHFVTTYPKFIHQCKVIVHEETWERVDGHMSKNENQRLNHHHGFMKIGPHQNYAESYAYRDFKDGEKIKIKYLKAGVRSLTVLKTTQSGFANFVRDQYTALPECDERLLATSIDSTWEYDRATIEFAQDYDALKFQIKREMLDGFAGPADTGKFSASLQETAYAMGRKVCKKVPGVSSITLFLPNIHNIPFNFNPFGLENKDHTGEPDIFWVTKEPFGIIQATVVQPKEKKDVKSLLGNMEKHVPYYNDYISKNLSMRLLQESNDVPNVPNLVSIGNGPPIFNNNNLNDSEITNALSFLCEIYNDSWKNLANILDQREKDRKFIDQRVQAYEKLPLKIQEKRPLYEEIIGQQDASNRVVIGKLKDDFYKATPNSDVKELPEYLTGPHVTIFGTAGSKKEKDDAMNVYSNSILENEPEIIKQLLKRQAETATSTTLMKWGADLEDSQTPSKRNFLNSQENLNDGFQQLLQVGDDFSTKNTSQAIVRLPGLALPCTFLFYYSNPIPMHLYSFAIHLYQNWNNPKALVFYIPKLENEEEALYLKNVIDCSERLLQQRYPSYKLGTVRIIVVFENPRAIFRVNEIADALHPYFAGGSLGWHDYLASATRLFHQGSTYRIPPKSDPNIVIKHMKAAHEMIANVIGPRKGICVGGMYGLVPDDDDVKSPSFQVCLIGYFKDVITQLKRGLNGFWFAYPKFGRIGLAIVEAWNNRDDSQDLQQLIRSLVTNSVDREDLFKFIKGDDGETLDPLSETFSQSLIAADFFNRNDGNDSDNNALMKDIRFNFFQALQYLAEWLSGNGNVALPATRNYGGVPTSVSALDDLATVERSRWEIWHAVYHKRVSVSDVLRIAFEELRYIKKNYDLVDNNGYDKKKVHVRWNDKTDKWYPVAMFLITKLVTDTTPVEFVTELLLPFTTEGLRESSNPLEAIRLVEPEKYAYQSKFVNRFTYFFERCGCQRFAEKMGKEIFVSLESTKADVYNFNLKEVIEAASFHGNIGEKKETLDKMAAGEQALVFQEKENVRKELQTLGAQYLKKFGVKFLVSAKGKSGKDLLSIMQQRINNSFETELQNARIALFDITRKRMTSEPLDTVLTDIEKLRQKYNVQGASVALSRSGGDNIQTLSFGKANERDKVDPKTMFEIASLSKTFASAFAIEYFANRGIPLTTSANKLLRDCGSSFRLSHPNNVEWGEQVNLQHLMSHSALNMHYVNGVPLNAEENMLPIKDFLNGNKKYDYPAIEVLSKPGTVFHYSGGGFLVLQHLIESFEKNDSIQNIMEPFLRKLGIANGTLTFEGKPENENQIARGYSDSGEMYGNGGRKMFPAYPAGACGTPESVSKLLQHLTTAYNDPNGSGPISHDTAITMLHGTDKGCKHFMGLQMGVGVFVGEAQRNRFAIHQGANDGYRGVFLHCFAGPDKGTGLVMFANGDNHAMFFISESLQIILKTLNLEGVDSSKFNGVNFSTGNIKQEEIVNFGYKAMVFRAFEEDLPEITVPPLFTSESLALHDDAAVVPLHELTAYNGVVGAKLLSTTDQGFAQAANLVLPAVPQFDPTLFCRHGKVMDSWETVRHNENEFHEAIFELKKEITVQYVLISTKWHYGNQVKHVQIYVRGNGDGDSWEELIPKMNLNGHSEVRIKTEKSLKCKQFKVLGYPDGGLTRVGLYEDATLPASDKATFDSKCTKCEEAIPKTVKPMSIDFKFNKADVLSNVSKLNDGETYNMASSAYGASIISCTNEHYGSSSQTLSPYMPLSMFDGFESSRSHDRSHKEEICIQLSESSQIDAIEFDFTYFVHNNPVALEVYGKLQNEGSFSWVNLVNKTSVKEYAGNTRRFSLADSDKFETDQIKVMVYPDGGFNRIRVFGKKQ